MKLVIKVSIFFFFTLFSVILLIISTRPTFALQIRSGRIQNSPAPSGNNILNNQVFSPDTVKDKKVSSPEASPVKLPDNPLTTQDRILDNQVASPEATPDKILNNQPVDPEKIRDVQVTSQIGFKNPLPLDEFLALQKRLGLNKVILESDFIYKGERIHDFFFINSPNQNIQEEFKRWRTESIKIIDEAKQKKASEQASQIIKTDNLNLTVTKVDSNSTSTVTNSTSTDNTFVITKMIVFDNKNKVDKISDDYPDAKINTTAQGVTGSVGLNNNIHPATFEFSNPNSYKDVPVSGYSGFGALEGVGRYSFQYMTWDVNNFASNEIYEHDIFLDNSDGKSYLDSSNNTVVFGCFPNITYALTSWPEESFPYIDTRFNIDENNNFYCETKGIAFTIGAAKAAALKAKTDYWTSIWTKNGNASTDQFTLELQVGPYKPDNFSPPFCPFPRFTPAWCAFDYKEGHIIVLPNQSGNGVSSDKTIHKWTNLVSGGIWQPWVYTGIPPQAPSNVFISDTTSSTQKANFTDNSTNEDNFIIEVKIGSGDWKSYGSISQNLSGYRSYSVKIINLSPNTQYCYRFKAVNVAGSSDWSNEACSKAS